MSAADKSAHITFMTTPVNTQPAGIARAHREHAAAVSGPAAVRAAA